MGGAPNLLGQMECDASIMCGKTLRCGAVGALRDYVHAITVARQVMERTPHTMLVGEGAALFAGEIGEQPTNMLTARAREDYQEWPSAQISFPRMSSDGPHDNRICGWSRSAARANI